MERLSNDELIAFRCIVDSEETMIEYYSQKVQSYQIEKEVRKKMGLEFISADMLQMYKHDLESQKDKVKLLKKIEKKIWI